MKYICVTTCFYAGRYYKKGVSADFPVGATVPEHFMCLEKPPVKAEEKPKKTKK